ncbi:MAG: hypothetical protein K8S99_12090 [Planctomycetes bacterium]|nr:hypothetical protein [Planctomycetota bacterium]
MAEYRAKPGMEDRHGEMTGAISINMILCMLPITVWGVFIGPWLLGHGTWTVLIIALAMAIVMPVACLPLSRWIWAHISDFMDRDDI